VQKKRIIKIGIMNRDKRLKIVSRNKYLYVEKYFGSSLHKSVERERRPLVFQFFFSFPEAFIDLSCH
jgi:hypothetical protein